MGACTAYAICSRPNHITQNQTPLEYELIIKMWIPKFYTFPSLLAFFNVIFVVCHYVDTV